MGHFREGFYLGVKMSLRVRSYDNVFRLQVHSHVNQKHFHRKSFAQGLVLKQRHKVTRKWPIKVIPQYCIAHTYCV